MKRRRVMVVVCSLFDIVLAVRIVLCWLCADLDVSVALGVIVNAELGSALAVLVVRLFRRSANR